MNCDGPSLIMHKEDYKTNPLIEETIEKGFFSWPSCLKHTSSHDDCRKLKSKSEQNNVHKRKRERGMESKKMGVVFHIKKCKETKFVIEISKGC